MAVAHQKFGQSPPGFLLLPVALLLAAVGALAMLLVERGAVDANTTHMALAIERARYIAEAGHALATTQLASQSGCSGYPSIAQTNFGGGTFAAVVHPASGSPATLWVTGETSDGARSIVGRPITMYGQRVTTTRILGTGGTTDMDAYITGEVGTHKDEYGDLDVLMTSAESGKPIRTLLQFNFEDQPPWTKVESVTLQLELSYHGSVDTVTIHRVLDEWRENAVSWEERRAGKDWLSLGGDFDPEISGSFVTNGTGIISADVTQLVSDWIARRHHNYGMLLKTDEHPGGSPNQYHSHEKSDEFQPRLIITSACECGRVC
ncbi:MAG: DNRLRE domain-containing protein [Pseudomonadota bacterium]